MRWGYALACLPRGPLPRSPRGACVREAGLCWWSRAHRGRGGGGSAPCLPPPAPPPHPRTGPVLLGVGGPGSEGQGLGLSVDGIALACHSRCSLEGRCGGSYLWDADTWP